MDSQIQNANERLERLVAEFDSAENVTKSLYQAAKKLPDHILCMGKFECKLTEELSESNIFSNDEFMRSIIEEWSSFATVSTNIGDEYVISVQKSLIEPLKKLKQAYAGLRSAIRLHDSIQLDVIKFQRKVASYSDKEKTGPNLVKLQEVKQALAASQKEFSRRTDLLIEDLSRFLAGSLEMFQPLLEGFIAAEIAWIRASKRTLDSKTNISDTFQIQGQSNRLKRIENSFKQLGTLAICSDTISK